MVMEYLFREIEEEMEKWLERREFLMLRGPRQSGKTTFLLHLKAKLPNAEYFTFQDFETAKSFSSNTKLFVERFLEKGMKYLLIDEAQNVRDVGGRLKLVYDLYSDRIKAIVTGSGNFDVKVNVSGYLVGRCILFELFPLSFEEFIVWRMSDLHKIFRNYFESLMAFVLQGEDLQAPAFEDEFFRLLTEFLVYGSFPAVAKERDGEVKRSLLSNLVSTYLEKDVAYFFGVRNLEKFRDLLSYLACSISGLVQPTSLSSDLKMSFQTLESYLEILQQSYIVFLVKPFSKNLATEIKKARKLFFVDLGMRNYLAGNFLEDPDRREDTGKLLENFVFLELLKKFGDWKINYWRTTNKAEIDFVISKEDKIVPMEVKFRDHKLSRGFHGFLKTYKPEVAVVFTLGKFGVEKIYGTKVAYIPHYFV